VQRAAGIKRKLLGDGEGSRGVEHLNSGRNHGGGRQAVHHHTTTAARGDYASVAQHAQVLARRGLAAVEDRGKIANGKWPSAQYADNLRTSWLTDDLPQRLEQCGGTSVQKGIARIPNLLR
jgi:hypothetical protein